MPGSTKPRPETAIAMVRDAVTGGVSTKVDLKAEIAILRADFYRALWVRAGVIGAAVVTLVNLLP